MRIENFLLDENDWVPNNPSLPVLIYRGVFNRTDEELARQFERLFADHDWPPDWRDGIYDYHHFHSTAHEALGVFAGHATLELGGPHGRRVKVEAGDALMLPTGTGHRCIGASEDFRVVGAYPEGQDWDICREAPDAAARRRMADLPIPDRDPVTGESSLDTES